MIRFIVFITSGLLVSSTSYAISLQDAIAIALVENPKPKSKDLQILAMKDLTTAAWLGLLPTLSLSCSRDMMNTQYRYLTETMPEKTRQDMCGAVAQLNIFNGGVSYFGAKSAEAEMKALEALYNSTNPLVENTKGALANLLLSAYMRIIVYEALVTEFVYARTLLSEALAATHDAEDISTYQAQIKNLDIRVQSFHDMIKSAKLDYEYIVTQPAPETFDTFDSVISSLQVPSTSQEAVQIAKKFSPDLKHRTYQLKVAEYAVQIARAQAYAPSLDVVYSKGRSSYLDRVSPDYSYHARDENWTIALTFNISLSSYPTIRARKRQLQSARLEEQAALDDLNHSLRLTYASLESQYSQDALYQDKIVSARAKTEQIREKIRNGVAPVRSDLLRDMGDLLETSSQHIEVKRTILMYKFTIQQVMGTLFTQTYSTQSAEMRAQLKKSGLASP